MRNQFLKTLVEEFNNDESFVYISADCGDIAMAPGYQGSKQRSINVGIAEQSMMSIAAGMAKEGKTVVVQSIGNFPSLRCIEQIRNDVCYHHLNVKVCTIGGGLTYGPAGVTHHSAEDFSFMRSLYNMTCFAPGDPYEVEACVKLMMHTDGPCYMRIGYKGEPNIHEGPIENLKVGDILEIKKGDKAAIFTAGNILSEGKKAVELLHNKGIQVGLYSFPVIKPLNKEKFKQIAGQYDLLVTLEENILDGGFGSMILETLSDLKMHKDVVRIGLDRFPEEIGSREYLDRYYHLDGESVARVVLDKLKSVN